MIAEMIPKGFQNSFEMSGRLHYHSEIVCFMIPETHNKASGDDFDPEICLSARYQRRQDLRSLDSERPESIPPPNLHPTPSMQPVAGPLPDSDPEHTNTQNKSKFPFCWVVKPLSFDHDVQEQKTNKAKAPRL